MPQADESSVEVTSSIICSRRYASLPITERVSAMAKDLRNLADAIESGHCEVVRLITLGPRSRGNGYTRFEMGITFPYAT